MWLRGFEMHALRSRALEVATISSRSGVVLALGAGVLLSAVLAAIVLLTRLPCIHVARAMFDLVLDATQRRVAEGQIARERPARKA